jgi:ubiquinone/menaquinone biosynthesis C-methylase UbiE
VAEPRVSLFARLWAAGYDRFAAASDRRGGAERRQQLVENASGDVLEVGAGTGKNFRHYRKADRVVALEPEPAMRARAERRLSEGSVPIAITDGDAMLLPFEDARFDTVVFGLVLCTISDPAKALNEARRVLKPNGELRFYEHVRSEDLRLARWQDRLARPWRWFGRGCNANRDTLTTIGSSGFEIDELERFNAVGEPAIVRPHVIGVGHPT